jgi:hypothetical protein
MTPGDDDKGEKDVDDDEKVANSRAGKGGEDGTYVGQASADDAIDAGETGAEARSRQENH